LRNRTSLEIILIDCGLGLIGRGEDKLLDLNEARAYLAPSQNSTYCSLRWRAPWTRKRLTGLNSCSSSTETYSWAIAE